MYVTLRGLEKVIFRNLYAYPYTYILALTNSEKRDHGFEGKKEGVYGRIWRK